MSIDRARHASYHIGLAGVVAVLEDGLGEGPIKILQYEIRYSRPITTPPHLEREYTDYHEEKLIVRVDRSKLRDGVVQPNFESYIAWCCVGFNKTRKLWEIQTVELDLGKEKKTFGCTCRYDSLGKLSSIKVAPSP